MKILQLLLSICFVTLSAINAEPLADKENLTSTQNEQDTLSSKEMNKLSAIVKAKKQKIVIETNTENNITKKPTKAVLLKKLIEENNALEKELQQSPENKKLNAYTNTFNQVNIAKNPSFTAKVHAIYALYTDENNNFVSSLTHEAKERDKEMRYIVVEKGDTLSKISKKLHGDAKHFHKIFTVNGSMLENPNLIKVGQKIRVPQIKDDENE